MISVEEKLGNAVYSFLVRNDEAESRFVDVEVFGDISDSDLSVIVDAYKHNDFSRFSILGEGCYGVVYEYKQFAIKRLLSGDSGDSLGDNDANVLSNIHHLDCIPNLYATIGLDTIVMEKIEGITVREYKRDYIDHFYRDNYLDINTDIVDKWSESLIEIIKAGYSPIDLHDENVMFDSNGDIKIIDVGMFVEHGEKISKNTTIDEYQSFYGYMESQFMCGRELRDIASSIMFSDEVKFSMVMA